MLSKIYLIFISFLFCMHALIVRADNKIETLERVSYISEEIIRIAGSVGDGAIDNKMAKANIIDLLRKERSPYIIARVAGILFLYIEPGNAEDYVVDNVLDEAWRACIFRIEKIGGDSAINAFEEIARPRVLDGGYSVFLKEALRKTKKRLKRE